MAHQGYKVSHSLKGLRLTHLQHNMSALTLTPLQAGPRLQQDSSHRVWRPVLPPKAPGAAPQPQPAVLRPI